MFYRCITFEPLINQISGLTQIFTRPVRDYLLVKTISSPTPHTVPLGTGYAGILTWPLTIWRTYRTRLFVCILFSTYM